MIKRVMIQITQHQVEQGFYTVQGDTLTMTDQAGKPLTSNGIASTHRLSPGENADTAAREILRRNYSGFNRPLTYGDRGWR